MSLFIIERNQGTAVYTQIARILETEFVKNGMPGDRLPSEGNLAEQFGVNRHTLRRAVDELITAGMLERLPPISCMPHPTDCNAPLCSPSPPQ